MMRVRVTTPNVLAALRKQDRGAAKPYNFALSPILIDPPPECTLVCPFTKNPDEWLTRDYTETNTGSTFKLFEVYKGKKLQPQTLSTIVWRHYQHPEDKSLSPDGGPCDSLTSGLLRRRPIQAMIPFNFIGKEVERRAQEGEDASTLENTGPTTYQSGQKEKTRAADAGLILKGRQFGIRQLMRASGVHQHSVERFLRGARVHPSTRAKLSKAIKKMELEARGRSR
jgi:hypothetical protein